MPCVCVCPARHAVLKVFLFIVLKRKYLCDCNCCFGTTKDKISKETGEIIKKGGQKRNYCSAGFMKFFKLFAPPALNILMVFTAKFQLQEEAPVYKAEMDVLSTILAFQGMMQGTAAIVMLSIFFICSLLLLGPLRLCYSWSKV